jgi:hypothetical protein
MTAPRDFRELQQLLGELVDDQLSLSGSTRLAELLRNDPAARQYYLAYMEIHARLAWQHERCDSEQTCVGNAAAAPVAPCPVDNGFMSTGPSAAGGFPVTYAIASMILGFGLAAAAACEASHGKTTAKSDTRAMPVACVSKSGFEGKTDSQAVPSAGQTSHVSITELHVSSKDANVQPKIAVGEREVSSTK